mmetsp:Transcript_10847/g.15984  ORF Transcript_10847/g.15984 Transcript_10847/m.15984 type:complete len:742 (+) Transcript_10847:120-2345(+)|eukprot:CAMPEP_0194199610 /NCGR_PEP_ID=MMETSP0156-20130528/564_1 /TAXON_ID=33649 /ORGANISM="Thalassionema nitzschioides, Strain L26-B" /LENGTH=741 /DNA_ID=CAMNT_0038924533 /DNA_START=29 /DNA_END=2254 /DNA_ORIENTATION=+
MATLEPPSDLIALLRESLLTDNNNGSSSSASDELPEEVLIYCSFLAAGLADANQYDASVWEEVLSPMIGNSSFVDTFRMKTLQHLVGEDDAESYAEEDDDAEELCNLRFNLAYGGKILLHQTKLRLLRGHRYGLVGQNGAGKTTLMSAINNGKLDGWPHHLKTHYVDSGSNVDPAYETRNVLTDLMKVTSKPKSDCVAMLQVLKFTDEMIDGTIGALSGGWQMKLRLVTAVLMDADILLMDEPTNHLDAGTVQWLVRYLLEDLNDTTVICVSHDTPFMEQICSDIIHYENREVWGPYRKLVHYGGTMSAFCEKIPQAKHYFELSNEDGQMKLVFPDPGRLEGVRTSTQKFLEMANVDFRYPGSDHDQLTNINLKMSLSSRIAVLGANGSGKTTLVKMIVGETQPSNLGGACKFYIHPNLRVAYVAQHAFAHVEHHMENSPVSYLQWRFKDGYDREKLESEAYKMGPEELKAIDDNRFEDIWSRRMRAGILEYEIKKVNVREKDNVYMSREELLALGLEKWLKQTDEKIAAKEAGLDLRPVTTTEIQKHLDDFGLAQEFGTYGKIRGLSGGQKVKLVLAAAMWNCPHLLVLDEPTNYLDREALGALSAALNEWGGSVLMISHNKQFYSSVCKEEWIVADRAVTIQGVSDERTMKVAKKKKAKDFAQQEDDAVILEKAGGNVNANGDKYKDATTNFWGQSASKKELRNYEKAKKKGDVARMRELLQIPKGKVMPGHEELGNGN